MATDDRVRKSSYDISNAGVWRPLNSNLIRTKEALRGLNRFTKVLYAMDAMIYKLLFEFYNSN